MGLFEDVNQAFSGVIWGDDSSQLDAAVATYGEDAVSDQAAELGYNLYDYWPPQSPGGAPAGGGGDTSGRMTRTASEAGSRDPFADQWADKFRSPAAEAGVSKAELVSNPDRATYDPSSPFYDPALDYLAGDAEEEEPKKKSKAGLWGFALIIAALAFGA